MIQWQATVIRNDAGFEVEVIYGRPGDRHVARFQAINADDIAVKLEELGLVESIQNMSEG